MLLEFWDNCDSHYKEIETDEIEVDNKTIEQIKNESYNQALEDFFNKCLEENIQFHLNPIDCMREVKEQLKK